MPGSTQNSEEEDGAVLEAVEQGVVGVGIVFDEDQDGLVVSKLVPNSGAELCGEIKAGDIVVGVAGKDVTHAKSAQDVAKLFAGPPGSTITVQIARKASRSSHSSPEDENDLKTQNGPAGSGGRTPEAQGSDRAANDDAVDVEILEVIVPRKSFDSDKTQFLSWMEAQRKDGELKDNASNKKAAGKKILEDSIKAGGALHGKILSSFTSLKSSVGESLKNWGEKNLNDIQQSVQANPVFETIRNRADLAKQAATSSVREGIKNFNGGAVELDSNPRHYSMHLYTCPDHYVVTPPAQPCPHTPEEGHCLVVRKSTMEISSVPPPEAENLTRGRAKTEIFGVLGIVKMPCASYLACVRARALAVTLPQGEVYRSVDIELKEIGKNSKRGPIDESRKAIEKGLLDELLDTASLFFSYDFDVTHTQQRLESIPNKEGDPLWWRYDKRDRRFVWNDFILTPLMHVQHTRALLPVVCGFVQTMEIPVPCGLARITLIARRDWRRAGYRYHSRGADEKGHASNFVETEQIIQKLPQGPVSSFVVTRGSIPLLWQEAESFIMLKPKPLMRGEESDQPLNRHLTSLMEVYGNVAVLSLIEQSESSHEAKLAAALAKGMQDPDLQDVPFIPFDFHKVCGKFSFKNLPQLAEACKKGLDDMGFYLAGKRMQAGVFRVNCIDCLDRTNVAQSVLAFHSMIHQLTDLECIEKDHGQACINSWVMDARMPMDWAHMLHQQFKSMWADHGDTISIQYSGSQALKGDLTRTGKRTVGGLLQDGVSSIRRAVQNNFADYHRQQIMEGFHNLPPLMPPTDRTPELARRSQSPAPRGGAAKDDVDENGDR